MRPLDGRGGPETKDHYGQDRIVLGAPLADHRRQPFADSRRNNEHGAGPKERLRRLRQRRKGMHATGEPI